jgi:signal transduction histidine kinase/CheY-like chemotaxis protein
MGQEETIKRALERERRARREAEAIIEQKSLEIYRANQELKQLNLSLEEKIRERTLEIEQSREELLVAKEKAEESTMAKSQFLSNMSHEIRTPLNGIIGLTEIMLQETGEPKIRKMLTTVKYSADTLLGIINDILDFSKIEAGKITFESIPVDLHYILKRMMEVLRHKAEQKGLRFILTVHPDVPPFVVGDKVKLNQILMNLLGNAIKFTNTGEVRLEVRVKSKEKDRCTLEFSVIDTGIGIEPEKKQQIFESFTQSNLSISRLYGGTGLGLSITKKLVDMQGGRIEIESSLKKGSAFIVRIPFLLHPKKPPKIQEKPRTKITASFPGKRILLVEDNAINQYVATALLRKWKFEVVIANHGAEALEILKEHTFDLVLLDLHMPVMDGFETCSRIRQGDGMNHNKEVPIVALTADAFEENKAKVLEAGMNDFAGKPINQKELLHKITSILQP